MLDIPAMRAQLIHDGYCVVPNVLPLAMLQVLRAHCSPQVFLEQPENFSDAGVLLTLDYRAPATIDLLTWPATLKTLTDLGFPDSKLHSFYAAGKQPGSEALAWHRDVYYPWREEWPSELFAAYYLTDTTPENGCLRVVPGSHWWISEEEANADEESADAGLRSDEVNVSLRAGDLFIGDRRILHATHANTSDEWRIGVTVAYVTAFDRMSEPIKFTIAHNPCLPRKWQNWGEHARGELDPRLQAILPLMPARQRRTERD